MGLPFIILITLTLRVGSMMINWRVLNVANAIDLTGLYLTWLPRWLLAVAFVYAFIYASQI